MGVVFVHDSDVVVDVLLVDEHALHAVLDYDGKFITVCRVVSDTVRDGRGVQQAVAILVLQTFTGQGRPPGSATNQKATGLNVSCGPGQIADSLHSEHGVENIKGNQSCAVIGVSRRRRDP